MSKKLHKKACRTCSTIIFPHSTNQIIDLWPCCCCCRRHFLRLPIKKEGEKRNSHVRTCTAHAYEQVHTYGACRAQHLRTYTHAKRTESAKQVLFCFCFYKQAQIISIPWNPPSFIFRALVIAAITIEMSKWSKNGKRKDQFAWFVGWIFISWHTSLATWTYTLAGCCNNILRADVSCPHSKSRPWLSHRVLTRIQKQKIAVMTRKRKNAHRISSSLTL